VTDNGSLGTWSSITFLAEIVKRLDGEVSAKTITDLLNKLDKPIVLGTVPDYAGIPNPPVVQNYPRVPTFKVYVSEAKAGTLQQDGDAIDPLGT
jgi:hypothetical protein